MLLSASNYIKIKSSRATSLGAFIFLLPALLLPLHLDCSEPDQLPVIKIGVMAPLSGDVAAWGVDTQRALKLAKEMAGADHVELIFEDDRCLGKQAVTAAQKLINIDRINFGMTVCTEPTLSVAPIFNQNKIVVVGPGATAAAITEAGPYIFRTWPSDKMLVEAVFDYIRSRHSRVGIISENRGFPQEFDRVFKELAETYEIDLISEDFHTDDLDLRSLFLRLRQQEPQALVLNTDSDRTLLALVKRLHENKWEIPLYGNFIAGTSAFLDNVGRLADGMVFGDAPLVDCVEEADWPDCHIYTEFNRRFGAAQSSQYMVASSISAFRAILESSRLNLSDPRETLHNTTFKSAIGTFSFDANGDVVGPTPSLHRISKGQAVPVE